MVRVNILDFRGERLNKRFLKQRLPRAAETHADIERRVAELLAQVQAGGTRAVKEFTERFDSVTLESLRVPASELERAEAELDPSVKAALVESISRARKVAADQRPTDVRTQLASGAHVTTRHLPIERVGLYVPGGLAVYPSTVVMNVVPAQAAGSASLAIASPPQSNGLPHPTVLATAHILGVDEVWAMGGAQAIGALAYGLDDEEQLDPVDLITGPGNAYVAAAKSLMRSQVGIDAVAGPTEIIILADANADPAFVAADLISQAEHDELAASVLVTDSTELSERVQVELLTQVPAAAHEARINTALSGQQSAIVLVDDIDAGIDVVNGYAGEHVEVHTAEADTVAARI
ncbi:MAG: histidinol dehydrogenase, partial [Brevibacterium aurantiacum]